MTVTAVPTAPDLVFERTDELATAGHEQVVFCRDRASGLRAIIALHDTRLGPALGGTRFYPYASEAAALTDVLRLSQGMTLKAAAAGLALGGGKAVIIGDPHVHKTPALLAAYGRFVDSLGGRYLTAGDVGTTAEDLDVVATTTSYVVGANGGSGDSGPSTALGVFSALRAAAEHRWGPDGLRGRRVGVEGVGKVGLRLVGLLLDAGAEVTVADASPAARAAAMQRHPGITARDEVLGAPLDVYAPCAMGATLTPASVARLRAEVVCGAANNQLLDSSVVGLLEGRGTTWVPDYVANAGGLIQVMGEIEGRDAAAVREQVRALATTVTTILERAQEQGRSTSAVAGEIAAERLAAAPVGR
ncbi:Glu/Leu/Phe/Val dehydrogenase [Nocardioides zeae]|uniref:Glu/Leu/Phe/Val dehydrogenase n=1 Tax=Nocardioides zeae TaxID=1457234 RepID=A0A6P0HPS5_9ACTN|nr:Glu/Leu/Phe/Val dehydrogenase [Nocardioides zeae]NEN80638.1 Glu/Leu/Phe/Val dehydrogenase [Nocardioides zeae]